MRTSFGCVAVLMLAVLTGGGLAALLGDGSADAQTEGETRTVVLDEGWNLAGWTGPAMPFADAIADILEVTQAAAAFDAVPQTFRTWNATAPPFLNTLDTLQQGEALWVQVTAPVDWVQPVVADPGPLALRAGFNLVTWAGPSGLAPADTFIGIETALNAAFAYDKPTETFSSFGPARPPFLNDLAPVIYGDGFWVLLDAPANWAQPAASPPAQVTGTDIAATLAIPRGALPPGLAPEDLRITDGSANPAFLPVSGPEPLLVVQLEPSGLRFSAPLTLTVQVALPSGATPLVVLISEDDVEALRGVTGAFDADSELTTLAIPISHFTGTTITEDEAVELPEFIDVGTLAEGVPFTVRVPVTRLDFEIERSYNRRGERVAFRVRPAEGEQGGWDLQSSFSVKTGPLTPPMTDFRTIVAGPGERRLVAEAVFTCTAPGDFAIVLKANVKVASTNTKIVTAADGRLSTSDPVPWDVRSWFGSLIIGRCVAHPATFELLDRMTFVRVSDIFNPLGTHIVVATPQGGADVREYLPITLQLHDIMTGEIIQEFLIEPPASQNCRGPTGCSRDIVPSSPLPDWVRLTALDKNNTMIAWQDFHRPEED